jgi:hypothetical protein
MGGSKPKGGPARTIARDELVSVALEALRSASALSRTQLKKALPREYHSHSSALLEILREFAARGEVERWQKGATELFFAADPVATLGTASRTALASGPLEPEALQKRLELETKIPKGYFSEWKKAALARGELFEIARPSVSAGSRKRPSKLLSLEPDLRGALKKALDELEKGLLALETRGVSRERAARFVLEVLGLPQGDAISSTTGAPRNTGVQSGERPVFLGALRTLTEERRAGALLLVAELRERTQLDKTRFDRIALELARDGLVDLHYHDHPQALDSAERDRLVRDDTGTHYVGIALRPTP